MKSANPPRTILPSVAMPDGTLEGIKWLALFLMTLDHVNKYIFHDAYPYIFDLGRIVMPLFVFVLAYNLARQDALLKGAYQRVAKRLLLFGILASVPFIALGGLLWHWYPFNIMIMLFVTATCIYLLDAGGPLKIFVAVIFFIVGGAFVEFWWPAVAMGISAWYYSKRPGWLSLIMWVAATASLAIINRNFYALAAFPIIFLASQVRINLPKKKMIFYYYYPAHLLLILLFIKMR